MAQATVATTDTPSTFVTNAQANFTEVYGMLPANGTIKAVPASAGATGTVGSIRFDGSYLYVCIATNTWVRCQVATWS